MASVTVVGIDQSLSCTGVVVLGPGKTDIAWRKIQPGKLRGAVRLKFIRDELRGFISALQPVPELIALEGYAYNAFGRVFELGELGGVIKVLASDLGFCYIHPSPTQVKKYVTNHADAEKDQVVDAVNKALGLSWTDKENDLADAAAIAMLARGYLDTNYVTQRHEAEVVKAVRDAEAGIKTKKSKPKKLRSDSI